jgi:hypothetical protein
MSFRINEFYNIPISVTNSSSRYALLLLHLRAREDILVGRPCNGLGTGRAGCILAVQHASCGIPSRKDLRMHKTARTAGFGVELFRDQSAGWIS